MVQAQNIGLFEMTIYILDNDPAETAKALDDKSLDKMIRSIAQVLSNVHHDLVEDKLFESSKYSSHCKEEMERLKSEIPLKGILETKIRLLKWSQWVRECKANYLYLVELGKALSHEYTFRSDTKTSVFSFKIHELDKALSWARDNVPDLPQIFKKKEGLLDEQLTTPLPLVMPKKYIAHLPWSCDGCEYGEDLPHDCDVAAEVRIIESYRNYYEAKLMQRLEKKSYRYGDIRNEYLKHQLFSWTRRQKPEWLNL